MQPSSFAGDDNHLFFQLGERLLISRKLTGNFPDFERVLPKEHPHRVTLKREDIRAAIERVAQFSDERSRAIRFQVCPGEVEDSLLAVRDRRERGERIHRVRRTDRRDRLQRAVPARVPARHAPRHK